MHGASESAGRRGERGLSRAPPALSPDRARCALTESPCPAPGLQPRPQAGQGARGVSASCGVFLKKNPHRFTKEPLRNVPDALRGCGDHGDFISSCCSDCWVDLHSSPTTPSAPAAAVPVRRRPANMAACPRVLCAAWLRHARPASPLGTTFPAARRFSRCATSLPRHNLVFGREEVWETAFAPWN